MSTDVITLLKQLLACPSFTPHDAGCQKIMSDHLAPLGFTFENLRFGDVDNLWARIGKNKPLFVFAGHTDVVPTGPLNEWTSPPFVPTIRDGYLYARGACDMKAALAAMIVATENFIKKYPVFAGSIAFLITSDEEGPSVNGTKKVMDVLKERGEQINYCIIGEPSSEHTIGDQIRVGRRGSLHGKLNIHGKQGHVAHPHLADNPIHKSAIALHELAQTEWDRGNEHFPPTTFQITNLHSGTGAANVIPGHVEALFNFRHSTAVTVEELKQRAQEIFNKYQLKFDIEWNVGALPFLTQKGRLLSATQQAIESVTGKNARESTGGGTSDGRFIAPTGAEVIELGVSHATAHQVDESVRVEDVTTLASIYEMILVNVLI